MQAEDIVKVIKQARKKKKLTQYQLSKKSGVSREAIARIENGEHIPNVVTAIKLLNTLKLELTVMR